MEKRSLFPGIDPSVWEHPADRAALAAFASIPGADDLIRRFVGSTTERALRLEALANGARVTETQFARVHRLLKEAARVLDAPRLPEAYIRLSSEAGAFSLGVDAPFLVLTSASLDLWDDAELLSVIGHELGHILSGHAIYKTMLSIIVNASATLAGSSLVAGATVAAIRAALREWDRKSELSADRAGLLVGQNPMASYRALMKTAGGPSVADMDLNEFFRQARDYDASTEGLDSLYKLLGVLGESHPFPVVRITALQEWEKGGSYSSVLKGEYARRGEGTRPEAERLFENARSSYKNEFSASEDPLSQAAGTVMDALDSLMHGGGFPGVGAKRGRAKTDEQDDSSNSSNGSKSIEDVINDIFGPMR